MKEHQIQEIKAHQEQFFAMLEEAMQGALEHSLIMNPDLEQRIVQGLRWGLFMRQVNHGHKKLDKKQRAKVLNAVQTGTGSETSNYLLKVSAAEVMALEQAMKEQGFHEAPIFHPHVRQAIQGKDIFVDFDYEDMEVDVKVEACQQTKVDLASLLEVFELRLTLPDVDEAFAIDDFSKVAQWQWEFITPYEEWKWEVEGNRRHMAYVQIGGHGRWIQGSYPDTYIAQVNNDVGDAGAVYVRVEPEGQFRGWVDMH